MIRRALIPLSPLFLALAVACAGAGASSVPSAPGGARPAPTPSVRHDTAEPAPDGSSVHSTARPPARTELALPRPELEFEGAAALGVALRRLGPTQRVLMIGAHPDDENNALLAELALGHGADVAYLSLTRGEGGQNVIGGELDEALGLIRTGELLAARRLDGAVQFFTRAYDFGYSKTAGETFAHWPRDSVLSDVVEVVRSWRPDVIVSVFSGTPRDGHGHHQAAGILSREAFDAAADPHRYPEQLRRGLSPHAPARLYQALWRPSEGEATLALETGEMDPLFGRSRFQLAMAGRSRHRSQDMGQALPIGPHQVALRLLEARAGAAAGAEDGLFEGLDTLLSARAERSAPSLTPLLRRYEASVGSARAAFAPLTPAPVLLDDLREALTRLDTALDSAGEEAADLRFHLHWERRDVAEALRRAAGVLLVAEAERAIVTPGDSVRVTLSIWNGGSRAVPVRRLEPELGPGWWAVSTDEPVDEVPPGAVASRTFTVHAPTRPPAGPYFLRHPAQGALYSWPDSSDRTRAFDAPAMVGAALVFDDVPLTSAVVHRSVDPAAGERETPLLFLPRVSVSIAPGMAPLVLDGPAAGGGVRLGLTVRSFTGSAVDGTLDLRLPPGWTAHALLASAGDTTEQRLPIQLRATPGGHRVAVRVRSAADTEPGLHPVEARFRTEGATFERAVRLIEYEHLQPRALIEPARAGVRVLDVRVPEDLVVGYVAGSGDAVPDALAALGVDVDTITDRQLREADLDRYHSIVTGVRAYEVRPALASLTVRDRLERYVRRGGALLVQYNRYEFDRENHALLPLTLDRPADRVTDETAAVRVLEPEHPILTTPNRIGPDDWAGWVQDRGLYHAESWDDRYAPLLEMADPGEEPQRGALLAARMGSGWYVYTGLALFRQLPAGVPGAYRLLANLVALGAQ